MSGAVWGRSAVRATAEARWQGVQQSRPAQPGPGCSCRPPRAEHTEGAHGHRVAQEQRVDAAGLEPGPLRLWDAQPAVHDLQRVAVDPGKGEEGQHHDAEPDPDTQAGDLGPRRVCWGPGRVCVLASATRWGSTLVLARKQVLEKMPLWSTASTSLQSGSPKGPSLSTLPCPAPHPSIIYVGASPCLCKHTSRAHHCPLQIQGS